MKVTIDVPAPNKLLEENSRLRQRVRNYRTTLRQLQKAHFISKELNRRYDNNRVVAQHIKVRNEQAAKIVNLEQENKILHENLYEMRHKNATLQRAMYNQPDQQVRMPVTFVNGAGNGATEEPNGH